MNEPTIDKLGHRLDRLERENRRLFAWTPIAKVGSLILLLLLLVVSPPSFAQEGSLWLAGISMRLGMSKTEVVSNLEKYGYNLTRLSNDSWIIQKKSPFSGIFESVGTVSFKDGKLIQASKDWGTFKGTEAKALGMALFSVLNNIKKEEENLSILTTRTSRQPKTIVHQVNMVFGKKKITLFVSEGEHGAQVEIIEILSHR